MAEPLVEVFLAKGRQSLDGAASEFEVRRYDNCANRAYYACFLAAVAVLIEAGARSPSRGGRWSHEFVQAQFVGQLINRRKLYPASLRQTLTITREIRHKADYQGYHVRQREAARALRLAREMVESLQEKTP